MCCKRVPHHRNTWLCQSCSMGYMAYVIQGEQAKKWWLGRDTWSKKCERQKGGDAKTGVGTRVNGNNEIIA